MNLSDLTEAEKVEILLSELQDAGEELRRWRPGDNRALRTVREMRSGVQDNEAEAA